MQWWLKKVTDKIGIELSVETGKYGVMTTGNWELYVL